MSYTVEDLLKKHNIHYDFKGADFLVRCLNPNHEDRNPSLRIDKITGAFNCFSCSFKGNLFVHYGEAPNVMQIKREKLKKRITEKRAETIGLSFPKEHTKYDGQYRGISKELYKKFEAFESIQKELSGRLVFPIYAPSGAIVAFIGRTLVNATPKYYIYPREAKLPLFPLVKPIQGSVILVEGIFDMLNLHQHGLTNAMCCFGVKTVNEHKLKMLKISGVSLVYVMLDSDTAGIEGSEKIKELCEKVELPCKNISYKSKDPGSLDFLQIKLLKERLYD